MGFIEYARPAFKDKTPYQSLVYDMARESSGAIKTAILIDRLGLGIITMGEAQRAAARFNLDNF